MPCLRDEVLRVRHDESAESLEDELATSVAKDLHKYTDCSGEISAMNPEKHTMVQNRKKILKSERNFLRVNCLLEAFSRPQGYGPFSEFEKLQYYER